MWLLTFVGSYLLGAFYRRHGSPDREG